MLAGQTYRWLCISAELSTAMMCYLCMLQANPALPVVERLEDLWLLSKLQQERKAKEQQQRHAGHQQAGKPLAPAAQQQQPQSPPVPSEVSSQTKAGTGPQSASQQQQEKTAGSVPETDVSMSAGFSSSTPGSGTETLSAAAALETTGPQKVPEAGAGSDVALEAEQQPGDSSTAMGQCAGHTAHGVAAARVMKVRIMQQSLVGVPQGHGCMSWTDIPPGSLCLGGMA